MRIGDIAVMRESGNSRIVDRKKDIILLVNGFTVFPNELENVISLCRAVLECAAIGVPNEGQLTDSKRPKHVELREALPKANVGDILRRELRTAAH